MVPCKSPFPRRRLPRTADVRGRSLESLTECNSRSATQGRIADITHLNQQPGANEQGPDVKADYWMPLVALGRQAVFPHSCMRPAILVWRDQDR